MDLHLKSKVAIITCASRGIGRFGTPEEIARVVAFLASSAAEYCQGSIIDVDGGQTRTL